MDGGDAVEIELTSIEPPTSGRGRRRRRRDEERAEPSGGRHETTNGPPDGGEAIPADAVRSDGPGPPTSPLSSDRGRLITTGVVVGVVALLLGWVLGRSNGPATVADVTSPTTSVRSRSSLPLTEEPIDTADFEESGPTSTRPARTTTTLSPDPVVTSIEIDPRLAGTALRIVGVDGSAHLVELDLAAGTLTEFPVRNSSGWDPSALAAGEDWVMLPSGDRPGGRVVWSDGSESTVDFGEFFWRVFPIPGTDAVWKVTQQDDQLVMRQQVLRRPDPTVPAEPDSSVTDDADEEIAMPFGSWPMQVDPRTGGVVTQNAGRLYSISSEGVASLGVGDLIAISADRLARRSCDEALRCTLVIVDRADGVETPVPFDAGSSGFQMIDGASSTFSPDGRWLVIARNDFTSNSFGVVDTVTGEYVELGRNAWPFTVMWTPDGSHALFLSGGTRGLEALNLATGETFDVTVEPLWWSAAVARPS